jgi:hypothetical protein
MLSYGKQHSEIPLWSRYDIYNPNTKSYYKERQTQYRNNENYLIKLNTHNIDDFEASLTAIYAPYTSSQFSPHVKNSDYDLKGRGLNIAYDMKNVLNFGLFKNTLAYKKDETTLDTKTNRFYVWHYTPNGTVNWVEPGWVNS